MRTSSSIEIKPFFFHNVLWSLCAIALILFLFSVIVGVLGANPVVTVTAMLKGAFGSSAGIIETLTRATPIMFCALAVALPARSGIFNIGGEGQLHWGAIGATFVALRCSDWPAPTAIFAMFVAAAFAGGLWASIPALLKAIWNVNEILVALMLNYVAILFVEHLVHGVWRDPSAVGWPYSEKFSDFLILPAYGATNLHIGLVIAVGIAVVLSIVMKFTVFGFSMKVIEANPVVAKNVGVKVGFYMFFCMVLGGVFAAFAGLGEVSVIQGRLRPGISPGYGYAGFLVSWLSGHRFWLIIPASILIGGLYSGADELQLTAGLPFATADIMMGMLFIGFLIVNHFRDRFTPLNIRKGPNE